MDMKYLTLMISIMVRDNIQAIIHYMPSGGVGPENTAIKILTIIKGK